MPGSGSVSQGQDGNGAGGGGEEGRGVRTSPAKVPTEEGRRRSPSRRREGRGEEVIGRENGGGGLNAGRDPLELAD